MSARTNICWELKDLPTIAPIDAGSSVGTSTTGLSVFLATHQTQILKQLAGFEDVNGNPVPEETLLQNFLKPAGNDPSITVISGSVGTGKSHMVRWLHARSLGIQDWHQVYIEKAATNLRSVIATILEGMTGPVVRELREKLASVSATVTTLPQAKARIAQQLAYQMSFPSDEGQELAKSEAKARQYLAAMLGDPILLPHLMKDGGAIHRISRIAFEGLEGDDDADRDLVFVENDLPLSITDLAKAAEPTQNAIRDMKASRLVREAAVVALNAELPEAKKAVFIGSSVDLGSLFDELRRELQKQDKELVLYIEDLVLLHGIDRELAQAFTVGRGNDGARCPMRVVIAVTDGYLSSGFDTLNTRAQHFSLNLDLSNPTEVPIETSTNFVGRYFNALRLGVEKIESLQYQAGADGEWIVNACDTCSERDECHRVFGTDSEGYGLFPLNAVATQRLTSFASPGGKFDPRRIIRYVIRESLEVANSELQTRMFPSRQFAATIDHLRSGVSLRIRNDYADSEIGQRQLSVRAYWDDQNDPQRKSIYEAFGLAPIDVEGGNERDPGPEPTRESPASASTSAKEIEGWVNREGTLSAPTTRKIRKVLHKALMDHLRYGATGIVVSKSSSTANGIPIEEKCIRIPQAAGGGADLPRLFEVEFDQSPSTGLLFQAILDFEATNMWSAQSLSSLHRLTSLLEDAASRIRYLGASNESDLVPAVQLLVFVGTIPDAKRATPGETLERILRPPTGFGTTQDWKTWERESTKAHEKSIGIVEQVASGAKGEGATSFLDSAQILKVLTGSKGSSKPQEGLEGSPEFVDLKKQVFETENRISKRLWQLTDIRLTGLDRVVDDQTKWTTLRDQVQRAVTLANNSGLLPQANALAQVDQLAGAVEANTLDELQVLRRVACSETRSLFNLMPDCSERLGRLKAYCDFVEQLLDSIESQLSANSSKETVEVSPVLTAQAVRRVADSLTPYTGGNE